MIHLKKKSFGLVIQVKIENGLSTKKGTVITIKQAAH